MKIYFSVNDHLTKSGPIGDRLIERALTHHPNLIDDMRHAMQIEYYGPHRQVLTYNDGSIAGSGWYDLESAKRWASENNCAFIDRRSGNAHADTRAWSNRFNAQGDLFELTSSSTV